MEYNYRTKETCSTNIRFDIEGDTIRNVVFTGGCNGNLQAIPRLVDGMTVGEVQGYNLQGQTHLLRRPACVRREGSLRGEWRESMIYKNFQGEKVSALGMGGMRLPVFDGIEEKIDEAAAQKMVDLAIEKGINYFDTAWGYHGGNSELVIGKALSRYPRESYYLADKFPGYDLANMDKVEEIFEKQLEKCGVSYFDFYLFHNVCEMNIDEYLNEEHGRKTGGSVISVSPPTATAA